MTILRRLVVVVATLVATLALTTGVASAHATVVSTSPPDLSTVPAAPASVSVVFSENVSASIGGLQVRNMGGRRVDADDDRVLGGSTLSVGLVDDIGTGTFIATYRVVSADGHPVSGSFLFGIGVDAIDPTASVATGDRAWEIAGAIARFALYLSALLAAGMAWFLAFVHDGAPDRWKLVPVVRIGSILALVAAAFVITVQSALLTGAGITAVTDPDVAREVLSGSLGWSLVVLFVGLAAVHGSTDTSRISVTRPLALYGALAVTVSFALFGHARELTPAWVSMGADAVHATAAALWLGGLVGLTSVLRRRDASSVDGTAGILTRFSTMAMVSVLALAAAGLALTATGTDLSWNALVDTNWGRLVIAKMILTAAIVAVAAWNRRVLVPVILAPTTSADAGDDEVDTDRVRRWSQLRRAVRIEAIALIVVLALTSVLVNVTPARTAATSAGFTVTRIVDTGSLTLSITPAKVGLDTMHIQYTDANGDAIDVANTATIEFSLPAEDIGVISREVVKTSAGHFVTSGPEFSFPGTWTVTIGVRTGDFRQQRTTFEVPITR